MSEYFVPSLAEIDYSKMALRSRVIIDGDGGCRKTSLIAPTIAGKIKGKVVSVDDFLFEPGHPQWDSGRPYWDKLDYQRLNREITGGGAKVVIEGACLLKVLARMNVQFDYRIFTKLVNDDNTFDSWHFEPFLNETVPLPKHGLPSQIAAYYREFKPFEGCDLMIERHIRPLTG